MNKMDSMMGHQESHKVLLGMITGMRIDRSNELIRKRFQIRFLKIKI